VENIAITTANNTPNANPNRGSTQFVCETPERLVDAVARLFESRATALMLIERGGAWIERERVRLPEAMLLPGMRVSVHTPPDHATPCVLTQEHIIYQDRWLIAINKPAGTYVDATPWDADNHLRQALITLWQSLHGETIILHPAHRLDRDTTGVLLFTRHPHANPAIQRIFVTHQAHKRYLCHVHGVPDWQTHTIKTGHGRTENGRFRAYPHTTIGQKLLNGDVVKEMMTTFHVIDVNPDHTALLLAIPQTGRTHQIRLHATALNLPIVGDASHGRPNDVPPHHLHAWQLTLPHPIHEEELKLSAPLPHWAPNHLALASASATMNDE